MHFVSQVKNYTAPPICFKEILRYASCKEENKAVKELIESCIRESDGKIQYKVCYTILPLEVKDNICQLGGFEFNSSKLASNLSGCKEALVFAASLGVEFDRLLAKYSRLSPAKALILQAFGAERIEALCDSFCDDITKELSCSSRPRFSPGYGDLELSAQKDLFYILDCQKKIGISLNQSLLISPSKSVTAIMGLCDEVSENKINKCTLCNKADCQFRCI